MDLQQSLLVESAHERAEPAQKKQGWAKILICGTLAACAYAVQALAPSSAPIAPETLFELNAVDSSLSTEFYKISKDCSEYFEDVSSTVAEIQNGWYAGSIETLQGEKSTQINQADKEYGAVMDNFWAVFRGAYNIQLTVESAQNRIDLNAIKMRKYLDEKTMWAYQHKLSLRTTKSCLVHKERIEELVAKLGKDYAAYPELLKTMSNTVVASLTAKYNAEQPKCKVLNVPIPKPTFDEPTTPMQIKALAQWKEKEMMREQQSISCEYKLKSMLRHKKSYLNNAKMTKQFFTPAATVAQFPADLVTEINTYDSKATAAYLANGKYVLRNMEGTEKADAQAANDLIQKESLGFKNMATKRGKDNRAFIKRVIG